MRDWRDVVRSHLRDAQLDPGAEADLIEEWAQHLEQRYEDLIARGATASDAERDVVAELGTGDEFVCEGRWHAGQYTEPAAGNVGPPGHFPSDRRNVRIGEVISTSMRYPLRRIRRSAGLTLAVVLTFALGIGANAVMFGILDQLLLRPPAHVAVPDRVSQIMTEQFVTATGNWNTSAAFNYAGYEALTRARTFSVAAVAPARLTLDGARQLDARMVSGGYFSVLGPRPALGRFLGPEDDRVDAERTAVIGHALWQGEYGGDRSILGRTLDFGHGPYTIVGVAPARFNGLDLQRIDAWLPLLRAKSEDGVEWMEGTYRFLQVIARLDDGVARQTAEAEATVLHRQGIAELAAGRRDPAMRVVVPPLDRMQSGNLAASAKVATWLLGVSVLVLLIACTNVSNLLLGRALRGRREIGVRLALGGSRMSVISHDLAEGLLMSILGGITALAVTHWGGAAVGTILLPELFWPESLVSGRVLALVGGLTLVAGLSAGLSPALLARRSDIVNLLRGGFSWTHSGAGLGTRSSFLVVQTALSVLLLIGAGLFVRSLQRVSSLDLGLDPDGVLLVNPIFQPGAGRNVESFYFEASERLRALPGVDAASTSSSIPFQGFMSVRVRVPGLDSLPRLPTGQAIIHEVEPDFFQVLRLRTTRGRILSSGDVLGAPPVVVVNETMARVLWPGQEPIGRCLIINDNPEVSGEPPPCAEVVGVVANARRFSLFEGESMSYYVAKAQKLLGRPPNGFMIRVRGDVVQMIATIQQELLEADPTLRYVELKDLRQVIDPQTRSWRLGVTMFSLFGLLALLVSMIGLYSVLAFSVAQRRFELGVRAALGATPQRLVGLVFGQAMRLVIIGTAVGMGLAVAAGRSLHPLLFEVSPHDPLVMTFVGFMVLLTGLVAAWIPSLQATRVSPATALRTK